jgi:hypothetical protein
MNYLFEYKLYLTNGEVLMNSVITSKKEICKAIGYTALLVASAIPLSMLSMQMINFILGNIKI